MPRSREHEKRPAEGREKNAEGPKNTHIYYIYIPRPLRTVDNLHKPTVRQPSCRSSRLGQAWCTLYQTDTHCVCSGIFFVDERSPGKPKNIRRPQLEIRQCSGCHHLSSAQGSSLQQPVVCTTPNTAPEHWPSSRKRSSTTRPSPAAKRCSLSAPVSRDEAVVKGRRTRFGERK